MAVTERCFAKHTAIMMLALLSALLLPSGCAVELSSTTPGAKAVCVPPADLTNFRTDVLDNLILKVTELDSDGNINTQRGCAGCHGNNSGTNPSAQNVFTLFESTTSGYDSLNYCLLVRSKQSGKMPAHILSPTLHVGGGYTPANVQPLLDFLNTLQ